MELKFSISKYKDDIKLIEFDSGKKVYLIGTAHVSRVSADLVAETLDEIKPDAVCIELDEKRYQVIKNKNNFENLDIIKILKQGEMFFFIRYLLLASFQKKISDKIGVEPGQEFKRVIDYVKKDPKCNIHLIDRNVGVTLKRAWRMSGFWGQIKLMAAFFFGEKENIEERTIEDLKNENELSQLIRELANELPVIKQVFIDERDIYLAGNIQKLKENTSVVVVGAGHVPGIIDSLVRPVSKEKLKELEIVPKGNMGWKLLSYLIPSAVIALFVFGFVAGDVKETQKALWGWVLINGSFSAIGCLIALAHPLTTAVTFLAAPITSLNPTIGVGVIAAFVQALCVRPRIVDFVNLQESASKVKKWWSNRLTKVLIVFLLSSIGSAIGTFAAFPLLLKIFPS